MGGYGSTNDHGEVWRIAIVDGDVKPPARLDVHEDGIFWGGQGKAIARLLLGIDPDSTVSMIAFGLDDAAASALFEAVRNAQTTPLVNSMMPSIDAIRLAEFLVGVTKTYFSLAPGADIVGGAADIATDLPPS